jgi:hypothetical protein
VKTIYLILILSTVLSCSSNLPEIKNPKKGSLKGSMELMVTGEKKFPLDSNTAPKPQYLEIFIDSTGRRKFTFINNFDNAIYIYDYESTEYEDIIKYEKNGPNAVPYPTGYHIKSMDSIYIADYQSMELILANNKSEILNKFPLMGDKDFKKFPEVLVNNCQYFPETSTPFIEMETTLLLPGFYIGIIPDPLIDKIKFMAQIEFETGNIEHNGLYPNTLYGSDFTWGDPIFTKVYPQMDIDKNRMIYSFPVSHNLYIQTLGDETYKEVYGGSNSAGTIRPLKGNPKSITRQESIRHVINQDLYSALLYDKYREVYYRFLRKAVPDATIHSKIKDKPIAVIVMDKNFGYLGETVVGNGYEWNWDNSFVTKEGLNIEYLDEGDIEEVYMTFKIFEPKVIK